MAARRGRGFSDPGSIPAGFGEVFDTVAGRFGSSHRLLGLVKMVFILPIPRPRRMLRGIKTSCKSTMGDTD